MTLLNAITKNRLLNLSLATTSKLLNINEARLCRVINTYTLMARLGPGGLAHHETVRGLIQLLRVSPKETRRGDQARFWSVRIEIDIVLTMAIVTD